MQAVGWSALVYSFKLCSFSMLVNFRNMLWNTNSLPKPLYSHHQHHYNPSNSSLLRQHTSAPPLLTPRQWVSCSEVDRKKAETTLEPRQRTPSRSNYSSRNHTSPDNIPFRKCRGEGLTLSLLPQIGVNKPLRVILDTIAALHGSFLMI